MGWRAYGELCRRGRRGILLSCRGGRVLLRWWARRHLMWRRGIGHSRLVPLRRGMMSRRSGRDLCWWTRNELLSWGCGRELLCWRGICRSRLLIRVYMRRSGVLWCCWGRRELLPRSRVRRRLRRSRRSCCWRGVRRVMVCLLGSLGSLCRRWRLRSRRDGSELGRRRRVCRVLLTLPLHRRWPGGGPMGPYSRLVRQLLLSRWRGDIVLRHMVSWRRGQGRSRCARRDSQAAERVREGVCRVGARGWRRAGGVVCWCVGLRGVDWLWVWLLWWWLRGGTGLHVVVLVAHRVDAKRRMHQRDFVRDISTSWSDTKRGLGIAGMLKHAAAPCCAAALISSRHGGQWQEPWEGSARRTSLDSIATTGALVLTTSFARAVRDQRQEGGRASCRQAIK